MIGEIVLVVEGLDEAVESLSDLPKKMQLNLQRALNRTADRTRTRMARMVREQVNFPASYLGPSAGRLTVKERATNGKLAVRIEGRDRPTSLARFATGAAAKQPGRAGIKIRVKPGFATYMPRAFVIELKNGNLGVAVRGKRPSRAYKPALMKNGLWLLYGPSVDQVLQGVTSNGRGVFADVEKWAADELEAEFWRLQGVEF